MANSALFLKALGARLARPGDQLRNRVRASRAKLGAKPKVAETLPEPPLHGDADRGRRMVAGLWPVFDGLELPVGPGSIWDAVPPAGQVARVEAARQDFRWLEDLATLGSRAARGLAQSWTFDWIRHYGSGSGPGWAPESAGLRAMAWSLHAGMLTQGVDQGGADRFWRALAAQGRYLGAAWEKAPDGLARLRALAGLVWVGRVLPHREHGAHVALLGEVAGEYIDAEGAMASRVPEDLAEAVILLTWTARLLEDGAAPASPALLAAIARAVPVLRALRLGDGALARFHGGGPGTPERLDLALAELRLGAQAKPRLPMGYVRLTGGRLTLVMDGAAPPSGAAALGAHASALAFEMSDGRQPLVVNAGPGQDFGADWAHLCRQTAAASTVEVDNRSSARIVSRDFAARTFGERLEDGPTLVSVRQAQDATGMWLLATQDGYVASHGLLHERRIFLDARGREARGEEILSVTDAKARARFDRAAARGSVVIAARFHLHPSIGVEFDGYRQVATLTVPEGDPWQFRAAGGEIEIEDSVWFDPGAARPRTTKQVVVRAEVVEYLGQITWSFGRVAEAPRASDPFARAPAEP
ncbi:heparinase II/III family protein [Amaricoccus solimangrovi]|uniref:Heparinase n=1 Tax=Amaricoccus solimangrovi TaxID=2589815 RepID=A0A501WUX0_9RHOB|nr:heparinase II/III family protein [Amaricoccus solimangrovi]TPE52190.1 heparinase [Amaricoccus solimangrovi]